MALACEDVVNIANTLDVCSYLTMALMCTATSNKSQYPLIVISKLLQLPSFAQIVSCGNGRLPRL